MIIGYNHYVKIYYLGYLMKKGLFITFEGVDGCGKSTQVEYFKRILQEKGIDFISVREPGGTAISEKIRTILLDKDNAEMVNEAEVLLYAASRAQLVGQVILPALKEGKVVLCDRYADSSIAYQGYGRQLNVDFVRSANSYALDNCEPDYTLYFDVTPDKVRARITSRGEADRLEAEKESFHDRVYNGYKKFYSEIERNLITIDASRSIEEVSVHVLTAAEEILKKW